MKSMNLELARVGSFSNLQGGLNQRPQTLAKLGYFYNGGNDSIVCYKCGFSTTRILNRENGFFDVRGHECPDPLIDEPLPIPQPAQQVPLTLEYNAIPCRPQRVQRSTGSGADTTRPSGGAADVRTGALISSNPGLASGGGNNFTLAPMGSYTDSQSQSSGIHFVEATGTLIVDTADENLCVVSDRDLERQRQVPSQPPTATATGRRGNAGDAQNNRTDPCQAVTRAADYGDPERRADTFCGQFTSDAQAYKMAQAGLYYDEESCTARCYMCKLKTTTWRHEGNPMLMHSYNFPNCPFVRNILEQLPVLSNREHQNQVHNTGASTRSQLLQPAGSQGASSRVLCGNQSGPLRTVAQAEVEPRAERNQAVLNIFLELGYFENRVLPILDRAPPGITDEQLIHFILDELHILEHSERTPADSQARGAASTVEQLRNERAVGAQARSRQRPTDAHEASGEMERMEMVEPRRLSQAREMAERGRARVEPARQLARPAGKPASGQAARQQDQILNVDGTRISANTGEPSETSQCVICKDRPYDKISLCPCGCAAFCLPCIAEWQEREVHARCPLCRRPIESISDTL